jgi:taurine transport system substrate-binding protein
LLAGLKEAGVPARDVNIVNLRPPEIAAAWERGDIDAAFIWDPALAKAKASGGQVIATSGNLGQKGYATFDGLVVNAQWAAQNEAFVVALVKAVAAADTRYRKDGAHWTADTPEVKAIAKWSKADPKDVPAAIALYRFPTVQEQVSAQWLGGNAAKALARTAVFLKEQGRVQEVKPDYGTFVTPVYAQKALGR